MKERSIILFSLILTLLFTSCSSLTSSGGKLDKVPHIGLFMMERAVEDRVTCYLYLTQSSYEQNQKNVLSYLGNNWAVLNADATAQKEMADNLSKKYKGQRLEGSCAFYSPQNPNRRILMVQLKQLSKPATLFLYDDKL